MENIIEPIINLSCVLLVAMILWLRFDINNLRSEMVNGFERVTAVLQDHGQRLTRIETHLEITHPQDQRD